MQFIDHSYTSTALAIATILEPPPADLDNEHGQVDDWIDHIETLATNLTLADEDHEDGDLFLDTLQDLRRRRDAIDQSMVLLAAYMRENIKPRPYTLDQVAAAAGMSRSGIRTFYTTNDIHTLNTHLTRARRILATTHNPKSHETHTPPTQ